MTLHVMSLSAYLVEPVLLPDADVLEKPVGMSAGVVVPHFDAVGETDVLGSKLLDGAR